MNCHFERSIPLLSSLNASFPCRKARLPVISSAARPLVLATEHGLLSLQRSMASCHCNGAWPIVISSGARRAESRNLAIDQDMQKIYIDLGKTGRSLHALIGRDDRKAALGRDDRKTLMERQKAAEALAEKCFSYTGNVRLGVLPDYGSLRGADCTAIICGEGKLALDASAPSFTGELHGEKLEFSIPVLSLPTFGICTDISRFYTFHEGKFLEFYPENNDALRWMHLVEKMHRFRGGKWQACPYRHNILSFSNSYTQKS